MKKIFPIFIAVLVILSSIIFAFRFPRRNSFIKFHPVRFNEKDFVELKTTSFLRDIKDRNIKAISGYFLSNETDRTIKEFNTLLNNAKEGEKTIPFDNISLEKMDVKVKGNKAYVFLEKSDREEQSNKREADIVFFKKGKSWKIISFPNLFRKQEIINKGQKKVIKK